MKSLVITGGVGTGKSTAVSVLKELAEGRLGGVDCDAVAHELLTTREIGGMVADRFGDGILNPQGFVDRKALREVVFADPEKRKALETILHPEIHRQVVAAQRDAEISESGSPALFLIEIPLYYEVDFPVTNDGVVVVASSPQIQRKRLRDGRGLSDDLISEILNSQLPIDHKVGQSDYVIWNEGQRDELKAQLELLLRMFIDLS